MSTISKKDFYVNGGIPLHVYKAAERRSLNSGGSLHIEDALLSFLGAGANKALALFAQYYELPFYVDLPPVGDLPDLLENNLIDVDKITSLFEGSFSVAAVSGNEILLLCASPERRDECIQICVEKKVFKFPDISFVVALAGRDLISRVHHKNFSAVADRLSRVLRQMEQMDLSGGSYPPELITNAVVQVFAHASYAGASDAMLQLLPDGGVLRLTVSGVSSVAEQTSREAMSSILNVVLNTFAGENSSGLAERPQESLVDFEEVARKTFDNPLIQSEIIKGRNMLNSYRYRLQIVKPRPVTDGALLYVVFRILRKEAINMTLDNIGYGCSTGVLKRAVNRPEGLILFVGTTGSGKTTSADSLLGEIDAMRRWVFTLENPIEFVRPLFNQHEVRGAAEQYLEFIKSFLRSNPDVCFFGECREPLVAKQMADLALTGSLVISTLHAADSVSAVQRLRDWGIDNNTIAESLLVIVAQRLYPKLCTYCCNKLSEEKIAELMSRKEHLNDKLINILEQEGNFHTSDEAGCKNCRYTGFSGQWLAYEILPAGDALFGKIVNGENTGTMKEDIFDKNDMRVGIAHGIRLGILDAVTALSIIEEGVA